MVMSKKWSQVNFDKPCFKWFRYINFEDLNAEQLQKIRKILIASGKSMSYACYAQYSFNNFKNLRDYESTLRKSMSLASELEEEEKHAEILEEEEFEMLDDDYTVEPTKSLAQDKPNSKSIWQSTTQYK